MCCLFLAQQCFKTSAVMSLRTVPQHHVCFRHTLWHFVYLAFTFSAGTRERLRLVHNLYLLRSIKQFLGLHFIVLLPDFFLLCPLEVSVKGTEHCVNLSLCFSYMCSLPKKAIKGCFLRECSYNNKQAK